MRKSPTDAFVKREETTCCALKLLNTSDKLDHTKLWAKYVSKQSFQSATFEDINDPYYVEFLKDSNEIWGQTDLQNFGLELFVEKKKSISWNYPHDSIIKFCDYIINLTTLLGHQKENSSWILNLSLNHLEILFRNPENRGSLLAHGILKPFTEILRFEITTFCVQFLDEAVDNNLLRLNVESLVLCLIILQRCTDAESKWSNYVASHGATGLEISLENTKHRSLSDDFLEVCVESLLVNFRSILEFSNPQIKGFFEEEKKKKFLMILNLNIVSLNTLASLLFTDQRVVRKRLYELDGLKLISSGISYPWILKHPNNKSDFGRISVTSSKIIEIIDFFSKVTTLYDWVCEFLEKFPTISICSKEWFAKAAEERDFLFQNIFKEKYFNFENFHWINTEVKLKNLKTCLLNKALLNDFFAVVGDSSLFIKKFTKARHPELDDLFQIILHQCCGNPSSGGIEEKYHIKFKQIGQVLQSVIKTIMENSQLSYGMKLKLTIYLLETVMTIYVAGNSSSGRWSTTLNRNEWEKTFFQMLDDINIWKIFFNCGLWFSDDVGQLSMVGYQELLSNTRILILKFFLFLIRTKNFTTIATPLSLIITLLNLSVQNNSWKIFQDILSVLMTTMTFYSDGTCCIFSQLHLLNDLSTHLTLSIPDSAFWGIVGCIEQYLYYNAKGYLEALNNTHLMDSLVSIVGKFSLDVEPYNSVCFSKIEVAISLILEFHAASAIDDHKMKIVERLNNNFTVKENISILPSLISSFFSLFPKSIEKKKDYDLVIMLLEKLAKSIFFNPYTFKIADQSNVDVVQIAYVDEGLLTTLSNILTINIDFAFPSNNLSIYKNIVLKVLNVFRALLFHNNLTKVTFNKLKILEKFRNMVFESKGVSPWLELIDELFALMLDENPIMSSIERLSLIRNSYVATAILEFFPHFDYSLQNHVLNKLLELVNAHEMNRVVFSEIGFVEMVVTKILKAMESSASEPHIYEKAIQLIEAIASFSLSVSDTKLLLRTLKPIQHQNQSDDISNSSDDVPLVLNPFYDIILRTLVAISGRADRDIDSFYFSGVDSGIILPNTRWFGSNGFSFFFWFKPDTRKSGFVCEEDTSISNQTLLYFADHFGSGIEFFMRDSLLHYKVVRQNASKIACVSDFQLRPERWHFITVSHSSPNFPWNVESEVVIFVDGNVRLRTPMVYPEIVGDILSFRLGCSPKSNEDERVVDSKFSDCFMCFFGQCSSIFIFEENIAQSEMEFIFSLGPGNSSLLQYSRESSLFSKIVVQYHPVATNNGSLCYNVGSTIKWDNYLNVPGKMKNVKTCSIKSFKSALTALGGVEVIFPVLLHLDIPTLSKFGDASNNNNEVMNINISKSSRVIKFLEILSLVLYKDLNHIEHFELIQGPKLISLLLQQCGNLSEVLSIELLNAFIDLRRSMQGRAVLLDQINEYLIMNFRLWSRALDTVQLQYFDYLYNAFEDSETGGLLRTKYNIIFFLDVLELYYWYLPPSQTSTIPTDWILRSVQNKQNLRSRIFSIMKIFFLSNNKNLTSTKMNREEVSRIVQSLWTTSDSLHLSELLQFVGFIIVYSNTENFGNMFLESGTMDLFFYLLKTASDESTQLITLSLIFDLISTGSFLSDTWKRKLRLEEDTTWCLLSNCFIQKNAIVSDGVFTCILQLIVEDKLLQGNYGIGVLDVVPIDKLDGFAIKNVNYLRVYLEILTAENLFTEENKLVLENATKILHAVITYSSPHLETFNSLSTWQLLLVKIVKNSQRFFEYENPEKTDVAVTAESSAMQHIFFIYANILIQNFRKHNKAWRIIEDTTFIVWEVLKIPDAINFILKLLRYVLLTIRKQQETLNFFGALKTNYISLLSFCERIMFNYQDMYSCVSQENPSLNSGQYSISRSSSASDIFIRISYPFEFCPIFAKTVGENISDILSLNEKPNFFLEKVEKKELVILQFKILLHPFLVFNCSFLQWSLALLDVLIVKHFTKILEFADLQTTMSIIGQFHSAYLNLIEHKNEISPAILEEFMVRYFSLIITWKNNVDQNSESLFQISGPFFKGISSQNFQLKISSDIWMEYYDKKLHAAMKKFENFVFEDVNAKLEKYGKRSVLSILKLKTHALLLAKELVSHELVSDHNVKYKREKAIARSSEVFNSFEVEKKNLLNLWSSVFQNLGQNINIWSHISIKQNFYKLDYFEDNSRMRRRLVIDYEHNDHRDASAKRDNTPIEPLPDIESILPLRLPEEKRKNEINRLKLQLPGISDDLLRHMSASALGSYAISEYGEEEEKWSLIGGEDLIDQIDTTAELFICEWECEMIFLMSVIKGRLELTTKHLTFHPDINATTNALIESEKRLVIHLVQKEFECKVLKWPVDSIKEVQLRRYKLRRSALELFLIEKTNFFFNFANAITRSRFINRLNSLKPANLIYPESRNPPELFSRGGMTEKWQRHEISNFTYLMYLNTVSGRSYNDLSQYPVFPWILTDYTSPEIDLNNPNIYRDLSKPIGSLNSKRLSLVLERYGSFDDSNIHKFMYGSHYSSAAIVLHYLLRIEPFTTLHITLQEGKFDHPDRLFHSIGGCWEHLQRGNSDVKELIPEFFYLPYFLKNENKFDLGKKQNGELVDDVILPTWASSREEFIRIHREALESEHVSQNLHKWIDLIWGYQQTGLEAEKANNVFYYLTYEGAINIEAISDAMERKSIEDQINNFGQTPSQLLFKPHPKRFPKSNYNQVKLYKNPQSYLINLPNSQIHAIGVSSSVTINKFNEQIVTLGENLSLSVHQFTPVPFSAQVPFVFEPGISSDRFLPIILASGLVMNQSLLAISKKSELIFIGGIWDNSFQCTVLANGIPSVVQKIFGSQDAVSCIALSDEEKFLVTGSKDTTVIVWEISNETGYPQVKTVNKRVLFGHMTEVSAVAINENQDLIVSGSMDGTCIIHTLQKGKHFSSISLNDNESFAKKLKKILKICITDTGFIIIHIEDSKHLSSILVIFSFYGTQITEKTFETIFIDTQTYSSGDYLIAATEKGTIMILNIPSLSLVTSFKLNAYISCFSFSKTENFLFFGKKANNKEKEQGILVVT
ncbi:Neurobeachin-like protein 1 [Lobulomyces angularis]|nr:Neurobeachin-like protein 1 [Lobulomyces angularis]